MTPAPSLAGSSEDGGQSHELPTLIDCTPPSQEGGVFSYFFLDNDSQIHYYGLEKSISRIQ